MSIVRMGMAEDGKFGDGYEAIFGKKQGKSTPAKASTAPAAKKAAGKPTAKKKPAAKKK
ncbi:MAG: hypothetical protein U0792_18250 [Gemmataceae bacterium]